MNNNEIIAVKFSDKYEKGLKMERWITPFLVLPALIGVYLLGASIKFILLMIPLMIFITFLGLYARKYAESDHPIKLRINEQGIYAWKRHNKEEFIEWNKVSEFRKIGSKYPDYYVMFYKKEKGFNMSPSKKGFSELALDKNSYQIVIAKFNEYKFIK